MPSPADPHAPAGKVTAGSADAPATGDAVAEVETRHDGVPSGNGASRTDVTPPHTPASRNGGEQGGASPVGTSRRRPEARDGAARAEEIERPPADRVMRRLLRVQGPPIPGAVFGAQGAMSRSIAFSAVRCTITYLLVPILAPIVGVLNAVDAPLSIALLTLASVMSIRSLRRFWLADHARRWAYTGLIAVVWVLLAVGLGTDVARLV